jgi:hypothetical protein
LNDSARRAKVAQFMSPNPKNGQSGLEKESSMKTQILAIAGAVVVSTFMAGECKAQSQTLEAKVPFAFEVGDKTVPAGNYRIESIPTGAGSLQVIRSAEGDVHVTLSTSTIAVPAKNANSGPELIFHRYGTRYFLAQIQTGDGHARELFESQREKKLAHSETINEVALLIRATAGKP